MTPSAGAVLHIGKKYFAGTTAPSSEAGPNGQGYQLYYYGIPAANRSSKSAFINYILSMYNGTNAATNTPNRVSRYKVASAYIIRTMIGSPVGSSKNITAAEITEWKARINSPNITMSTGAYNAGINSGLTTDSLYRVGDQYYDVVQFRKSESVASLLFRDTLRMRCSFGVQTLSAI